MKAGRLCFPPPPIFDDVESSLDSQPYLMTKTGSQGNVQVPRQTRVSLAFNSPHPFNLLIQEMTI